MQRMRILIAVFALVLAPISGAAAMALGWAAPHHHCVDAISVDEVEKPGHHAPNLDPFTCDQCHLAFAALPMAVVQIVPVKRAVPSTVAVSSAQAEPQLSLFRPPKV